MQEKSMHDIPLVEAIRVCMMPALSALSSSKNVRRGPGHMTNHFAAWQDQFQRLGSIKKPQKLFSETYSPEIFSQIEVKNIGDHHELPV